MPYTPGQVSSMLKIPPSTVRLYAKLYADFLSPQDGRKHRLYTETDLVILARIKDLRSSHVPMDAIANRLQVHPQEPARIEESALSLVPSISAAIENANEAARAAQLRTEQLTRQVENLSEQLENQAAELAKLKDYVQSPWYKKIFSRSA